MKEKIFSKLLCVLSLGCCLFVTSCVSAIVDSSTSRHRDVLEAKGERAEFRKKIGNPVESWQQPARPSPQYKLWGTYAYDVFEVNGQVARPGDGAAQATVSAVSMGAGEAIVLPLTLVKVGQKVFKKETLVVYYNKQLRYKKHRIFSRNGDEQDTLGY